MLVHVALPRSIRLIVYTPQSHTNACIYSQSIVSSLNEDVPQEGAMESEVPSPSLPACSAKDRALLLALALKWRKESKTSSLTLDQVQECEREIWVEHIRAAMEASNVSSVCYFVCLCASFRQPCH